ncbi:MAG TPA: lipopolysaccharide biosynthesis protein [Solirubrobacterales bacterium]|nr:lipopolysaccharide biosynthesis protein [Solirubrobacterales bacterium]
MSERARRRPTLFRNTLSQSAPTFINFGLSFILAPIMLSRLGLAQFGVWAVTGALAQYARLFDFGVTRSLARFVALFDAQGDRRGIEESLAVGVAAVTVLGSLMLVAAVFAAPLLQEVLGVLDTAEMRIVLLSSVGILITALLVDVINAVPVGLRQMGPPNAAAVAGGVVNFVASVVVLTQSSKLPAYAVVNFGAAAVAVAFALVALVKVWPGPYLSRPNRKRAREIMSFGLKSQAITAAELVNVQTDKLIIAAMLGPRTAGAYEIANRVVQGVLAFGTITLSAMIPTATAEIVERGRGVIEEFYARYTRTSLSIALPLFGALCVSCPFLLVAWLGERPPETDQIVVLLSIAFAASLTTGVAMTLVMADGHPGLVAQTAILVVVLNVGSTLAVAPIFGLWGVLVATVAAEVIASTVFLVRFHRRYGFGWRDFRHAVGPPLILTLVVAIPFALVYVIGVQIPDSRLPALAGAIATGGTYGVICWLIASSLRMLPQKLSYGWLRARLAARGGLA